MKLNRNLQTQAQHQNHFKKRKILEKQHILSETWDKYEEKFIKHKTSGKLYRNKLQISSEVQDQKYFKKKKNTKQHNSETSI